MSTKDRTEELRRNLQAKLERLLELQNVASVYQQVIEANTILLSEVIRTRQAIKDLMKFQNQQLSGLVSLGPGVFIEGEISVKDRLLVDVGAGIAVPMSLEAAMEHISAKERMLRNSIERSRQAIAQIQNMINKLQQDINKLREQLERKTQ